MTDQREREAEPMTFPGNDDPAIEAATDSVVETWNDATPGKDPNLTTDDFERMREGFGDLADEGTRSEG